LRHKQGVGRGIGALGFGAGAALAWGWFEAGWVRLQELPCPVPGLPEELAGLRIAHLSDFHLGVPSRGGKAVELAVEWTAARHPDVVCLTGDLLTRPAGVERLRGLLSRLPDAVAVLGNHEIGLAKDPLVARSEHLQLLEITVLRDAAVTLEARGRRVQLVGVDPRTFVRDEARPAELADPEADLRILLCHFPRVVDELPPVAFHLVLAGHVHDGQIAIPYGFGKLRLGEPRARYPHGIYQTPAGTLHVSAGLGTTFVPFRFSARPEATELVLQPV
jgi:predicted MPP superfamily phosphohydrolase